MRDGRKVDWRSIMENHINNLIKTEKSNKTISTKNISDGYHTFGELYHHRAVLFSVICNQNKDIAWKSLQHDDGTMFDGDMFIVGVETPQGQYTYHYHIEPYWNMFDVKELDYAPKWDGHQPSDITRLFSLFEDNKCEYCNNKKSIMKLACYENEDDVYINGTKLMSTELGETVEIKFCPMCGRKL